MSARRGNAERAAGPARAGRRGMSPIEAVVVALRGLGANKLRSFLTMLGIIIGVCSVILTVALGEGAAAESQKIIDRLGANVLFVTPEAQKSGGVSQGAGTAQTLTLEDADALLQKCPSLVAAAPERYGRLQVQFGTRNTATSIIGATPENLTVRTFRMAEGKYLTNSDRRSRARVAVLGSEAKKELFGENIRPLGKTIKIKGQNFRVIGVLHEKGTAGFYNPDTQIWVPLETAMTRLFGVRYLNVIGVQAASPDVMGRASEEIHEVMRRRHRVPMGAPPSVKVHNQADFAETAAEQGAVMTLLLSGIATVSLLVGGIGIMNIMLVSVTERTREIGIRKALGARRSHILSQFLIESVTLSVVGGGLGVAAGIWGGHLLATHAMWPVLVTPQPIVVSFLFSAAVGIFFGIYPAVKAAQLDPIQALRYE